MVARELEPGDIVTPDSFEGLDLTGLNFPTKKDNPADYRALCAKFQYLVDVCELKQEDKVRFLNNIRAHLSNGSYNFAEDIIDIDFRIAQSEACRPRLREMIRGVRS